MDKLRAKQAEKREVVGDTDGKTDLPDNGGGS